MMMMIVTSNHANDDSRVNSVIINSAVTITTRRNSCIKTALPQVPRVL